LYSGIHPLTDKDYQLVQQETKNINKYPVYYVDTPGTVEEIKNTILVFNEMYCKEKWLLVTLDHTLLTKGLATEKERETLFNLQRAFIELKKINKTTILQLSQLNREIEETSRLTTPSLHFPQRKDVFGGDSVYQASDYVIVLHRPEILGLKGYGPNHWPVEDMIYMHLLKVREGEPKILSFVNNLKFNSIEESITN